LTTNRFHLRECHFDEWFSIGDWELEIDFWKQILEMTSNLILAEMAIGEFCQPQFDLASEIPEQTVRFPCDAPSLDVEPIAKFRKGRVSL
jgi:hypothetical protein